MASASVSSSASRSQMRFSHRPVDTGDARSPGSARDGINVGQMERLLSVAGGGFLTMYGLQRGSLEGLGIAAIGGSLLYRGMSGHCPMYSLLDAGTEKHSRVAAVAAGHGIKVVQGMTINRPAVELYRVFRHFENLPRFMEHLISVEETGEGRSHWVARGPAGTTVAWDAEIINDDPGRLIAWRSLHGSRVGTAGSVHFNELPFERGTEVRVSLKYDPPGGKLGSWLAWLFGENPRHQVREDLRRFKELMEAGEIPSVKGQPSGRRW
jgi:uncharacterized membrane protein